MAEHAGARFLCCEDARPAHETSLCFYVHAHYSVCPAIHTLSVVQNSPQDQLLAAIPGIFYNQFFCEFAVSQKKDEYYATGCRRVKFYAHCHCSSPQSLQCKAATASLKTALYHSSNLIKTEHYIVSPKICCDSWMCVPIRFLGYHATMSFHFYYFLLSDRVESKAFFWPDLMQFKVFKIHDGIKIAVLKCGCALPLQCKQRVEEHFNLMRMFISCVYDSQEDFVEDVRNRSLRLVFEGMPLRRRP
ncbi:hypothetical protein [Barthadenovirus mellis]|uniref:E4.2 n=1 Tax=Passerine adenovirus 1 TaxID=2779174 RepID=A0A7L9DK79_9ADEN|nr:hypothetical protein [Passerine adenovirus 1]